ncbi:ATP-binding cassette domain-containing protein [Thermostaphylospora chromogena]|uniref:ABC-2 type transport system ATP-binding protein n=1 Tax=Thermostaphylospora chromogena TaxID=35622 RepID=A0A1H1BFB0_9ACTN|nr:ATP-binding cassette domain-containing protein [Thermostaphylospora chromogena]SDQ50694.1 ABC-2 type transport system ATP-binding protein [Thermostaphylospora chromogena]
METVAEVRGLGQGYGRRQVITDLNLDIQLGVLGLLGPNGAGKTTLLQTLATILPPRRGTLRIGTEVVDSARKARRVRREIGYLPQHFGYYPAFSVYDFVRYCAWLRGVPESEAHAATVAAIGFVGLSERSDARLKTLSGGMIRRCGIASAIVGSPRLILLDEPTVGLDPAQRLEFRTLIRRLRREGKAVVLSTHLVEDVAAVCDRVAVMADGRVTWQGRPDELAALAVPGAEGDTALERGYMSLLGARKVAV